MHPNHHPELRTPLCAVKPQSTDEVRRIVQFANAEKIALVPFGGGSGLMGGAIPIRPCLAIDLRDMKQIVEIDTAARSARVQAGVVLESLDTRLNELGYILGHDPWTVPVATIGGAISTNSVGYRAGIYGSMGEQVLGLEAVLPNGEILRTRPVSKHSAGIDLNALLIGGEGCFGIITEATIRIFPKPASAGFLRFSLFFVRAGITRRSSKCSMSGCDRRCSISATIEEKHDPGALLYLVFEGNRRNGYGGSEC